MAGPNSPGVPPPSIPPWTPSPPPPPPRNYDLRHVAPLWGRALGLLLIGIGTIVAAAFDSVPGSCYVSNQSVTAQCPSLLGNLAWALLAARLLWALGLLFLAGGAALRLHWLSAPTGGNSDEFRWAQMTRWANFILLIASLFLLCAVFIGSTGLGVTGLGL